MDQIEALLDDEESPKKIIKVRNDNWGDDPVSVEFRYISVHPAC